MQTTQFPTVSGTPSRTLATAPSLPGAPCRQPVSHLSPRFTLPLRPTNPITAFFAPQNTLACSTRARASVLWENLRKCGFCKPIPHSNHPTAICQFLCTCDCIDFILEGQPPFVFRRTQHTSPKPLNESARQVLRARAFIRPLLPPQHPPFRGGFFCPSPFAAKRAALDAPGDTAIHLHFSKRTGNHRSSNYTT